MALITACHIAPGSARGMADDSIDVDRLLLDPDPYMGKVVMLGGVIEGMEINEGRSMIYVLEKPLDYRGRPDSDDPSRGSFIIAHGGPLEPEIYKAGRLITVIGEIAGKPKQSANNKNQTDQKNAGMHAAPDLVIRDIEMYLIKPGGGFRVFFGLGVFHTSR